MCCNHLPMQYELSGPDKALPEGRLISTPGEWRRGWDMATSTFSRVPWGFAAKTWDWGATGNHENLDWEWSVRQNTDKASGSLAALSEGCTSNDLSAEVPYVIPRSFHISDISLCSDNIEALDRKECRKSTIDWMKWNKTFYFSLPHFLIQMFLSLKKKKKIFWKMQRKNFSSDILQPNSASLPRGVSP